MMEEGEKVNLTTFGKKKKDQDKRNGKLTVHPCNAISLDRVK